jgi:GNAT superfamily N-acetyltransferase
MPLPDYLPGRFALARGRASDYFALEHFHYLPQRPATYADVWVAHYYDAPPALALVPHLVPPLAAGFPASGATFDFQDTPPPFGSEPQGRRQAAGLTAARTAARELHLADHDALEARWHCATRIEEQRVPRLAAVAVLSYPTIRSSPRERALGLRDAAPRDRAAFVNGHVRTVSRVVVHPQFRALGLASALVRKLIAVCPTRYVEAAAVMAHVHPFFAAAGMRQIMPNDDDNASKRNHLARPAYFLFDKSEGSPCE